MDQSTKDVRLASWAGMITACNNSGLTVREWCRQNGISEKTYHYRKKTLRENLYSEIKHEGFVEVANFDACSFKPVAVLKSGNISLELSNEVSPVLLENISRMLSRAE